MTGKWCEEAFHYPTFVRALISQGLDGSYKRAISQVAFKFGIRQAERIFNCSNTTVLFFVKKYINDEQSDYDNDENNNDKNNNKNNSNNNKRETSSFVVPPDLVEQTRERLKQTHLQLQRLQASSSVVSQEQRIEKLERMVTELLQKQEEQRREVNDLRQELLSLRSSSSAPSQAVVQGFVFLFLS